MHSQHDDIDTRVLFLDLYRCVDARHAREAYVHQDHIRTAILNRLQAILGIFPDPKGLYAIHCVHDLSNQLSECWSVLNDGDLDGFSIKSGHDRIVRRVNQWEISSTLNLTDLRKTGGVALFF